MEFLKPTVDREFRTHTGPASTAIAGSSMGGLMSCYAIIERPDVFGRAACVSSHWPIAIADVSENERAQAVDIWQSWLSRRLGAPRGRRIWMDHGDETLDALYAPYQQAIDRSFRSAGWQESIDFESKSFENAPHEENAWAKRLPEVLEWTLRAP